MIRRAVLVVVAATGLAGCGSSTDPAEAGQGGWSIPAGVYGNVAQGAEGGTLKGVELRLDKGSESDVVEVVLCDDGCGTIAKRPLLRGLNGVSFTLPEGGRKFDVMIQPAKDGVTFNIDRGNGIETEMLPRIDDEVGLAAARSAMATP